MEFTIENYISDKLINNDLSNLKKSENVFEINLKTKKLKRSLIGVYDAENLIAIYYKEYKKGKDFEQPYPYIVMYGEILFNDSFLKVNIFYKQSFSIYLTEEPEKNITPLITKLLYSVLDEREKEHFNMKENQKSLEANLVLNLQFKANRYFLYHKDSSDEKDISGMLFFGEELIYLFGNNRVFLEQKGFKDLKLSSVYKEKIIGGFNLNKSHKELFIYNLSDYIINVESKKLIFSFENLVDKTNKIIESF